MNLKIVNVLNDIEQSLHNLERRLNIIEEKIDLSMAIQKNHLVRIKNREPISDEMILSERTYNDLSPDQAYRMFQDHNLNYILVDVSRADTRLLKRIEGAIQIPLEEIEQRYHEFSNRTTPILFISEDGTRSILACEKMIAKGHFNVNNISGGHRFWPGHKKFAHSASKKTVPDLPALPNLDRGEDDEVA